MTKKPITPRPRSKGAQSTSRRADSANSTPTAIERQEAELPGPLKALIEDPDALRSLGRYLPSWFDELSAALLVGVGAVALASLLNTSGEGSLSADMATTLRQSFGDGSYFVAIGVLLTGLFILLPKIGIKINFSWMRLIGLEVCFVAFLSLLHGFAFAEEGRALARAGGGGGYVGWAVNNALLNVLGEPLNLILMGGALVVGLHLLVGIGRRHYRALFDSLSAFISATAERINPSEAPDVATSAPVSVSVAVPTNPSEQDMNEVVDDFLAATSGQPKAAPSDDTAQDDTAQQHVETVADNTPPPAPTTKRKPSSSRKPSSKRKASSQRRQPPPPPAEPKPIRINGKVAETITPPETVAQTTTPDAASDEVQPNTSPTPPTTNEEAASVVPETQAAPATTSATSASTEAVTEDIDADTAPSDQPDGEQAPVSVLDRPVLVINGQEVRPEGFSRERPSIVPRDEADDQPRPAVLTPKSSSKRRKYKGGRDNNPDKRYFTVADFSERRKVGKRLPMLPPLELLGDYDLNKPDQDEINKNATTIENTLLEFDIDADVIDVKVGPVVTQYAVSPIKETLDPDTGKVEIRRVRVDRITSLQGDLALALSARTLRIEAPVPGHSYVGIEVPNSNPSTVGLRGVIESITFYNQAQKTALAIPLGRDVSGESVAFNLASLPHLLVAGTTGSGKSVFLTSVITSLVMTKSPDELKLILLDPKRVELTRFNGLPHLIGPVETEADRIVGVLRWTAREMDRRYKLMELENARNLEAYNASLGRRRRKDHLPYIVMVFDEVGDLMMTNPDETEGTITRLAQKARAAGIHLVVATQRPSTDVLTGLIKANFPGRLSFAVAAGHDSRVILDYVGAETLLGRGDLLFLAPDASGPVRIQGCFVGDDEVEEVVMYWNNWREEQVGEGNLEEQRVAPWERGLTRIESLSEQDPMLEEAIQLVVDSKEASTSLIQRRLGIGYPRAARLMDSLYELGIIGPPKAGGKPREVRVRTYKSAMKMIQKGKAKK